MSNFSVSPNPSRYRIGGLDTQQYALPPSSAVGLGEGLLFGLPGGGILALPVALRVSGGVKEVLLVWLATLGLYGMLLAVLAASLRIARPLPRHTPALLVGLGFALGPLAMFGTLLSKHTHHRPLGAATYAVSAIIIVALAWALAARALVSIHSSFKHRKQFGWALVFGGTLLSLAAGAFPFSEFLQQFGRTPLLSSFVIDGLLGMALSVVGGFARFPNKLEATARSIGPTAFGICALTFAVAMQSPLTGPALAHASALWAWLGAA
jgi:hypothetical protein